MLLHGDYPRSRPRANGLNVNIAGRFARTLLDGSALDSCESSRIELLMEVGVLVLMIGSEEGGDKVFEAERVIRLGY